MALRLRKIKRWYMSMYDSEQDIIQYSDTSTLLHETRHRWQLKECPGLMFMRMVSSWALMLSIAALIGEARLYAGFFFGIYIGYYLFLELDANIFSYTKGKRGLI